MKSNYSNWHSAIPYKINILALALGSVSYSSFAQEANDDNIYEISPFVVEDD